MFFEGAPGVQGQGTSGGPGRGGAVGASAFYDRAKRVIDIAVSVVALVVLSPLLAAIAVGVRLDSPGPVVFRQERIGRCGNPFIFYKFRSMEVGAEEAKARILHLNEAEPPLFKMRNDPRITRCGRLLRKCGMDELPQLVNVLRGDMSFVGPRPHLPDEAVEYTGEQQRRLSVTPGITCLWQVSGPRRISFREWIEKDLEYVEKRSLWLDFVIVLKTIRVVLTGDSMY